MKTCLLTGSGGFLGSHLLPLLKKEYSVYTLTHHKKESGIKNSINVDFSKDWNINVLPKDIDLIIHLAQSEYFKEFPQKAKHVYYVNTVSTLKLLDFAVKNRVKKFVYTSSGGVYGYSDNAFSENHLLQVNGELGFYLGSKLCSELLVENYQSYMDVIILRPFFMYGPGQKDVMLIPRLVRSVIEEKIIELQGKDGIKINPTYIDDATQVVIQSLELNRSYKINIAGPQVLTLREMAEIIGKKVGKKPIFSINTRAKPKNIIGDVDEMNKHLIKPTTFFSLGIQKYIDSLNKN